MIIILIVISPSYCSYYYLFFFGCRLTDNLPCSTKILLKNNEEQHEHGYRLGAVINDKVRH